MGRSQEGVCDGIGLAFFGGFCSTGVADEIELASSEVKFGSEGWVAVFLSVVHAHLFGFPRRDVLASLEGALSFLLIFNCAALCIPRAQSALSCFVFLLGVVGSISLQFRALFSLSAARD